MLGAFGQAFGDYLSIGKTSYPFGGSRTDAKGGDAVQAWACEESHARYGKSGLGDG
jgi:hypothetical protein